jgi:hypothetical protein
MRVTKVRRYPTFSNRVTKRLFVLASLCPSTRIVVARRLPEHIRECLFPHCYDSLL